MLDISDDTEIFTISREYSIAGTLRVLQCPSIYIYIYICRFMDGRLQNGG